MPKTLMVQRMALLLLERNSNQRGDSRSVRLFNSSWCGWSFLCIVSCSASVFDYVHDSIKGI